MQAEGVNVQMPPATDSSQRAKSVGCGAGKSGERRVLKVAVTPMHGCGWLSAFLVVVSCQDALQK